VQVVTVMLVAVQDVRFMVVIVGIVGALAPASVNVTVPVGAGVPPDTVST
jgi:hypothetical protein